jgi:hypothetical protein
MRKSLVASLLIILAVSCPALMAARPIGVHGLGPRVGFTVNPDQFQVGGQIDFGDLADNLMILPNLEIGFGDDLTLFSPSFELDYRFRSDWSKWTPYLGGGVGPIFYSTKGRHGGSNLGLYLQGGIARKLASNQQGHFFVEVKLGLEDAPDAKFTVGWTFGD